MKILVNNGHSTFWVKNPKKVKWWKGFVARVSSRKYIKIVKEVKDE